MIARWVRFPTEGVGFRADSLITTLSGVLMIETSIMASGHRRPVSHA
jgi:hypothetical protein